MIHMFYASLMMVAISAHLAHQSLYNVNTNFSVLFISYSVI